MLTPWSQQLQYNQCSLAGLCTLSKEVRILSCRSTLCRSAAQPVSGVHNDCSVDARARDRRNDRALLRCEWSAAEPACVSAF